MRKVSPGCVSDCRNSTFAATRVAPSAALQLGYECVLCKLRLWTTGSHGLCSGVCLLYSTVVPMQQSVVVLGTCLLSYFEQKVGGKSLNDAFFKNNFF